MPVIYVTGLPEHILSNAAGIPKCQIIIRLLSISYFHAVACRPRSLLYLPPAGCRADR